MPLTGSKPGLIVGDGLVVVGGGGLLVVVVGGGGFCTEQSVGLYTVSLLPSL